MDPQIVYGLAFADMELGDNRAGEGAIRVLEIEAPEELRGLESHVLRALPERVTFLRWSLQGHHVICLLRSLGSRHLRLGLPAFGRSLLNRTPGRPARSSAAGGVQRLCVWQDGRPHSVWLIGKS